MHIFRHSLLRHIYAKTSKGQDEIVRPKFGLDSRQRRVLAFVDGSRSLAALQEHFPMQEMEDIVSALSSQHFIFLLKENPQERFSWQEAAYSAAPSPAAEWKSLAGTDDPGRACMPPLTLSDDKVRRAKEFMLEVAAIHLGILGRDIIRKIEAARDAPSLAGMAGQWTMALCASKTANRYAQLYLEQLKSFLFEEQREPSVLPHAGLSSWSHMTAL